MKTSAWKYWLIGIAMAIAAGGAAGLKPASGTATDPDLQHMIPVAFGEWRVDPEVVPIPPSPDVQDKLNRIYGTVVSRTYVNTRGERMMLTIAYGGDQSDALKAHRQEVCYAAQGFDVANIRYDRLPPWANAIPVTRLVAVRGPRSEPVTYWFTMGDRVVLGRLERLWVQIRFGLSGRVPDGMLVRVSSISRKPDGAFLAQQSFIHALLGVLHGDDRARLLGTVSS